MGPEALKVESVCVCVYLSACVRGSCNVCGEGCFDSVQRKTTMKPIQVHSEERHETVA